jgi:D-amino-acid dehydrogenase
MGGAGNAAQGRALAVQRGRTGRRAAAARPLFLGWVARFLRNCDAERFARNKTRMQRIAHYSKACLKELRDETRIAFDHGTGGVLQLFRTEAELAGADKSARVLAEFGVEHRILDAEGVVAVEPALRAAAATLAGGLHLPGDETGDCHAFTSALAELLHQRGVEFGSTPR